VSQAKIVIFDRATNSMRGILTLSALVCCLLLLTSCERRELDQDVAWSGTRLPNYCDRNAVNVSKLEKEPKAYGSLLAKSGYVGGWEGLPYAIACHHFVWGDYGAAQRVGAEVAGRHGIGRFVEYDVACFLNSEGLGARPERGDRGREAGYMEVFHWNAGEIDGSALLGFTSVADSNAFESWVDSPMGTDAILVLAARLLKKETGERERMAIVRVLDSFFGNGKHLERFTEFAERYMPRVQEDWVSASLLYERYWHEEGNPGAVTKIREARKFVANRLVGTSSEADWVQCVLEEKGLFAATGSELKNSMQD
jgi:hypothetical protein